MHQLNLSYNELRLVLQTLYHREVQTENPNLKARLAELEEKVSQQAMAVSEGKPVQDHNADQRMQDKLADYLNDLMKREGFPPEGGIKFVLNGQITFDGRTYWLETEHQLWQEM